MRLAVVSPYAFTVPGGVNNHIRSLVDQLGARGHEVWMVAPVTGRKPAGLPDNFISAGTSIPVPGNGSVAYTSIYPFMLGRMTRILNRYDFDLVHVHEPTIPAVAAAATMMAKVPVAGTFHAAGSASEYYERWRPLAERILASITVRIAVSEAARDCAAKYFPADYRVIPNGIDVETYSQAREGRRVPGRILFIGRPEPRKGLQILVEAFRNLRERKPGLSLTLVGPTYEELHGLLARSKKDSPEAVRGITALGRVSLEAKIEQMAKAEVLCAPSLGGESFGIVLTEALAAGLPVVASDIPGYRAVLAEGSAGVLVPPGNATALENALLSVLGSAELRADLATYGIGRAERYSWDRVIDQVLDAYDDAIRLGPRMVAESPVPALRMMGHFLQRAVPRSPRSVKPREASDRAAI